MVPDSQWGDYASHRFVDPFGREIYAGDTLSVSGDYHLIVDHGASANAPYAIRIFAATEDSVPLPQFNSPINGELTVPGEEDVYTFHVSGTKQVMFNHLTGSTEFNVTLTGPRGTVFSGYPYSGDETFELVEGNYELIYRSNILSGPESALQLPATRFLSGHRASGRRFRVGREHPVQ